MTDQASKTPSTWHPISTELTSLARALDGKAPKRPHKPFVVALVRELHRVTGRLHPGAWYAKLIRDAGIPRTPSARTISAVLQAAREVAGEAPSSSALSVREIRRQMTQLARSVDTIRETTNRQLQIADALAKRQLMFADQAQTYQRQIDQLAGIVDGALRTVRAEVDRMARAAADMTLDSHRVAVAVRSAVTALEQARAGLDESGKARG